MLRMIQSQSAEQAKDYHKDELSQSDYYTSDTELKGWFRGRIAQRLGIEGEAQKWAFDALCDNLHPVTFKSLTLRTVALRTVGYDINFHCPKSVSVLHVLSGDDHILNAFRESVHATMLEIEADAQTRVRKNGKDENRHTGELVWAEFIHQTARPVKDAESDMHLHCHCFTINLSFDPVEQCYKAGQFQDIKRDMPYYEARFHKRLSDALIALGYRIRRTGKFFEVEGVPQQIIDLFSKRTNEIGQIAKELGITDAEQLDQLGAKTRAKKKKGLSMSQLKEDWRRQIHELGMTDDDGAALRAPGRIPDHLAPSKCVDHALLHCFERASVVHDRRLLESAYRHAIGFPSAPLNGITDAFKRNPSIITVQEGSRLLCTTHEILAMEKRMVSSAVAGKGKMTPLYQTEPQTSLEGDQANAITHVLTTTDRVSIVWGRAGTGKTTLMKELNRLVNQAGKRIIMVAPTAQASRGVLREEGFEGAETLAKLLTDPELQKDLAGQILVLDEGGLCGTADMTAALELATKQNARLVICGDTRQHSSVVRGDALRVLCKVAGIVPAEVSKIYRQRNVEYKEAIQHISDGKIKEGFDKLDAMGAIKQIDPANPCAALADDYIIAIHKGKTTLIVSPTHRQGEEVTKIIRQRLQDAGKLDKQETALLRLVNLNMTEAEKADFRMYQIGQVIQFSQNRKGIKRGSRWSVSHIEDGSITIEDDENQSLHLSLQKTNDFAVYRQTEIRLAKGDMITVTRNGFDEKEKRLNNGQTLEVIGIEKGKIIACTPANKEPYTLPDNYSHLSHAYCITSHASQGKTVDEIFVMQSAETLPATNMQQFYVSLSRGRDMAHVYTDDKEALLKHASQSGDRMAAMELVKPMKPPPARTITRRKRHQAVIIKKTPSSPKQPMRSFAAKPYL